jgi:glutamate-1-semialdehyde 2,1-aminomutase
MNTQKSENLYKKAKIYMPGGVNSPVRAFNSVSGTPRFIKSAKNQYLFDEDGNKYIDYIGSWGPMILGHNSSIITDAVHKQVDIGMSYGAATQLEVEMADLINSIVPCVEMMRMVNSGTEAVMSAIRAARGYNGKNKIIKFEGCYHGHADSMLACAGSGLMTSGIPDSSGVPKGAVEDTLLAVYNDIDSVEKLFENNKDDIACVIVEPIAANMGVVLPEKGFLESLRSLCTKYNSVLIFDEVITGFRLALNGAIGYFGIEPDIVTYGKIIGGGMPVGAYGGKREIMEKISPLGSVYQAGTLSGNPVAMAAGIAQLSYLKENADKVYPYINSISDYFRDGLRKILKEENLPYTVNGVGSLSCLYFSDEKVDNYTQAKKSDTAQFAKYFNFMLENGIYFGPSQFEAIFISYKHTKEDIDRTLECAKMYFKKKGEIDE